ncbi:EVE domain-containing protein [Elsinoe fawcettii]|nr:EVE domain-containing protein [Elsinoe fawcettii]
MPPKKRKAPPGSSAPPAEDAPPTTRTRATRAASNPDPDPAPATKRAETSTLTASSDTKKPATKGTTAKSAPKKAAASTAKSSEAPKRGRPAKTAEVVEEQEKLKRGRAAKPVEAVESAPEPAKKRGWPGKAEEVEEVAPKKRGRAAKVKEEAAPVAEPVKKRGRPAKASQEETQEEKVAAPEPKKGRGRKAAAVEEVETVAEPVKKGRGKGKAAAEKVEEKEVAEPKKRGRPARAAEVEEVKPAPKKRGRAAKVVEEEGEPAPSQAKKRGRPAKEEVKEEPKAKKPRGRPAKAIEEEAPVEQAEEVKTTKVKGRGKAAAASAKIDTDEAVVDKKVDTPAGDRSYWLMKAEPESRLETTSSGKQVDISFTIDDLKNKNGPEPWDGIRNHQAQKNLRAMSVGDLCFFSESNCKVPGIVGIMEVVGEARPDPAQFNPDSPYYDPKATEAKPKWNCVMVEFRRKFSKKLPAVVMREFADKDTDPLNGMQLFRQTRLSVSKVEDDEWEFIMNLIEQNEAAADTASGTPAKTPNGKSPGRKSVGTAAASSSATPAEPAQTQSALATGNKSGRKSTVTFAEETPVKGADEEGAASNKKTPARYRKTPAKSSSTPADIEEESEDELAEPSAESAAETPAPRRGRKAAATPASEPKPAVKKTPASKAVKPPATEPRPRGRPSGSKSASATPVPTPAVVDDPTDIDEPAEQTETPAPRRGRAKAAATPASEPKPAVKKTPAAKKTGAPQTEPRPRGRPAKTLPPTPTPDAGISEAAEPETNGVEETNGVAAETPAPRRGRGKAATTPATEPKPVAKTPAAKKSSAQLPKTEPRPRGRGKAAAIEPAVPTEETPAADAADTETPAPAKKSRAKPPTPATEPRPTRTPAARTAAIPKTEPKPRGRPAAAKSAAKGKKTSLPAPSGAGEEDSTLASLDPTPSKPLPVPSLPREVTGESRVDPSPADALSPVRGSQEVPSSSPLKVGDSVPASFYEESAEVAADVADAVEEAGVDAVPGAAGALDQRGQEDGEVQRPGSGTGQTDFATGDGDVQISIQEPTELTFADAQEGPDVADVTGQSVGSAEVHDGVAEVQSPDATLFGSGEGDGVLPSTEPVERIKTPEPGYSSSFGEGHEDESRKSFLGRLSEGLVNVVTSPGRAVARALSGTPGPREKEEKEETVKIGEGLGTVDEVVEEEGGPKPVQVEEVRDEEL